MNGTENVEPAKSAADLHFAEVAAKNGYVNNPHTSSYFWAIEKDGAIVLREYDDCACETTGEYDPTGHLHTMDEWPDAPFVLHAEPKTLDHQSLPELAIEIGVGEKAIWGHRVRVLTSKDGLRAKFEDVQIFGKTEANGVEHVQTIYPDGALFDHDSYDEAQAHGHPHLPLEERPDVAPEHLPFLRIPPDDVSRLTVPPPASE